jgi:tRNA A-37 threonylcarbamoyl transferase component Bud32/uncharacterized membrane protein YhaH (DUF805 family)
MPRVHACGAVVPEAAARFCGGCGLRLDIVDPELPFAVGSEVRERYRVIALLGRGAMSTVFRAHDRALGSEVALKALAPELVTHATARRRMHGEARLLASIAHPNVVRILDHFDEGSIFCIVLELVDGGTARDLVGHVDPDRAVQLMIDVLLGLEAVHASGPGRLHRDIKPENILLTPAGRAKLADFGVARDEDSGHRTRLGVQLGTVPYMSPEQVQGLAVDARSDLFSAAATLFELVASRPPFRGETEFEIAHRIVSKSPGWDGLRARAPEALFPVLYRGLAKDPGARFGSAAEMRLALEEAVAPHRPTARLDRTAAARRAPRCAEPVPVEPALVEPSRPGEFSFEGRLGRGGFIARSLAFGIAQGVGERHDLGALPTLALACSWWWFLAVVSRRTHDLDASAWAVAGGALATLLVVVALGRLGMEPRLIEALQGSVSWSALLALGGWLCLYPGSRSPNEHGPAPRSRDGARNAAP